MASTTISLSTSGYLTGRIVCSSTSNGTAANSSNVTIQVQARRTNEYTTYGTWTGSGTIDGTTTSFSEYAEVSSNWVTLKTITKTVAHNNDGTKTITVSGVVNGPSGTSMEGVTVSGSGSFTLDTIPRYTVINTFTVSQRTETSFTFGWGTKDTIDYAWHSTNNGSTWTGVDVTDGTSGTFVVSNLSPGTTYNCKIKVRRKDSQLETISSTISATTFAAPTQSLVSKTETSITIKWTLDTTADYIEYTTNSTASSPTWVAVGSVNAKTGQYTISGLTANTTYNIKTRVRRKSSQTKYATSNLAVATYDYPKVSAVGTSELVIGNQQTLTLYNPLSRSVTIKMYKTNISGTELYSGTASGTSKSFTPTASTLYASIPSATSAKCVYSVIYGSSTKTTGQHTYKVKGTETPTFTNFTFADTNFASLTGNNQVLIQGLSNLRVTIPSANKMVAKNSASGNKYTISCDTRNGNVNYSADSDVYVNLGTITTSGSKAISVSAYDSRNLYTTVIKNVTVVPYAKSTIVSSATRLNKFENQTTLKVNGTFSKVTVDEVDKNTITNVKYRVREVGGEWGSLTAITFTTNDNKYTCSDVTLDLDNTKSFEIEVQTTDTMGQVTTSSVTVNIGVPSFFIKKAGGFESNGASKITGTTEINGNTVVSGSHYLRINGSASSSPLRVRGIAGVTSDGSAFDTLYLQHSVNKPIYLGNTGAYNISADGGTYSGKASTAGTADDATKVAVTSTNPSSNTTYYPTWVNGSGTDKGLGLNNGLSYISREGTTSADGTSYLVLGNSTASGTAKNKTGFLRIYDKTAYYIQVQGGGSTSANRTWKFPNHSATFQGRPTELYNNTSGTGSTITLSASSANYNYLEIFFKFKNGTSYSSTRVQAPNGKRAGLVAEHSPATNSIQLHTASVSISTTTVKFEAGKSIAINSSGGVVGYSNTNEIYIYKILGWL